MSQTLEFQVCSTIILNCFKAYFGNFMVRFWHMSKYLIELNPTRQRASNTSCICIYLPNRLTQWNEENAYAFWKWERNMAFSHVVSKMTFLLCIMIVSTSLPRCPAIIVPRITNVTWSKSCNYVVYKKHLHLQICYCG